MMRVRADEAELGGSAMLAAMDAEENSGFDKDRT